SLAGARGAAKRVLAPIAFIPVAIAIRSGPTTVVEIACQCDGADLVLPNAALLAWLEQQTGQSTEELFADEQGSDPWREICSIVKQVAQISQIDTPELFLEPAVSAPIEQERAPSETSHPEGSAGAPQSSFLANLRLEPAPRAEEGNAKPTIVPAAVLG